MNSSALIFLSSLLFIVTGCNIDGEDASTSPPAMDVSISYIDENGNDALDPDLFQFFNVYYLQKNEETGEYEAQEAALNQYHFYIDSETSRYALRIFPNRQFIDGQSQTLIEDPRDDFDTLRVQGYNEGRGSFAERIWYNDSLVWQTAPNPQRRFFTITKPEL